MRALLLQRLRDYSIQLRMTMTLGPAAALGFEPGIQLRNAGKAQGGA